MIISTLLALGAYLIGSLSAAIIISKLMGLPDPRTQGSRNPGATNVLRIAGKKTAALVLESPNRGHDDGGARPELRNAALYIEELLRSQLCTESRLSDDDLGQLARQPGRDGAVAAVGDIRERAAMYESGGVLQRLNEVRVYRVPEKNSHSPLRLDLLGGHGLSSVRGADNYPLQPLDKITVVTRKTENGHHLGRRGNVETILPGYPVLHAAQSHKYFPQRPVV